MHERDSNPELALLPELTYQAIVGRNYVLLILRHKRLQPWPWYMQTSTHNAITRFGMNSSHTSFISRFNIKKLVGFYMLKKHPKCKPNFWQILDFRVFKTIWNLNVKVQFRQHNELPFVTYSLFFMLPVICHPAFTLKSKCHGSVILQR